MDAFLQTKQATRLIRASKAGFLLSLVASTALAQPVQRLTPQTPDTYPNAANVQPTDILLGYQGQNAKGSRSVKISIAQILALVGQAVTPPINNYPTAQGLTTTDLVLGYQPNAAPSSRTVSIPISQLASLVGGLQPIQTYPSSSGLAGTDLLFGYQPNASAGNKTVSVPISQLGAIFLPLSGGTLTGPLVLNANPSAALGAATRQYVDAATSANATAITAVQTTANAALSRSGGTMIGQLFLNGDPTTALGAATKAYVDAHGGSAGGSYLPLTGGTLTGALILSGDPVTGLGAATRQYVDSNISTVTTLANNAVPKAGGAMTGALSSSTGTTAGAVYNFIGTTGFSDQIQGAILIPSSTPSSMGQMTAVAGYVKNQVGQSGSSGQPNGVALFGAGTAEANNSATWGINTILQDSGTRAASSGTGKHLLNEFDFTVTSANTVVSGLNFTGSSLVKPVSSTALGVLPFGDIANGINVGWDQALWSTDGAATFTTVAGLAGTTLTANGASQIHMLEYADHNSARQFAKLYVYGNPSSPFGGIFILDGSGQPLSLQLNGFVQVGGAGLYFSGANQVVGPRIGGWGSYPGGTRGYLNSSTATAGQCALAVNALINDLQTHGLLGQ